MINITIDTDGAAFDGAPFNEASRILKNLAEKIEHNDYYDGMALYDLNGNKTGVVYVSKESEV